MKFLKDLIEKVKGLWNIYGGVGMSLCIGWFTKWSKTAMEAWATYLTLLITCIGLLTFFKVLLIRQKKNKMDVVSLSANKNIKKMDTALDPEKAGEEIGNIIVTTIKGGKIMEQKLGKLLKLWWGNKFTLLSLLLDLLYTGLSQYILYSDSLKEIPFFVEHKLLCIIIATSVSAIWLFLELFKDIKNYGFESIKVLEAKWKERRLEKEAQLSPEQKKIVKDTLNKFKSQLKFIDNQITEKVGLITQGVKTITALESLRNMGIELTQEQQEEYKSTINSNNRLNSEKAVLEQQKLKLESEINTLKQKL